MKKKQKPVKSKPRLKTTVEDAFVDKNGVCFVPITRERLNYMAGMDCDITGIVPVEEMKK